MKIIILTAKFGMGHYSAAKAIEKKIKSTYALDTVKLIDMVEYMHGDYANPIYNLYSLFIEYGSKLYNLAYKKAVESTEGNGALKLAHKYLLDSVEKIIRNEKPDIIVSTYSISSELVSTCKRKNNSNYQLITVITDVKPHYTWVNEGTDAYLVADEKTKEYLLAMGVEQPIYITGIPVSEEFEKCQPKGEFLPQNAKNVIANGSIAHAEFCGQKPSNHNIVSQINLAQCNYSSTKHIAPQEEIKTKRLLIMGGGLGMIPQDKDFYQSLNRMENLQVTVITGKNKKLYKKLQNKFENIEVLGYSREIPTLMREADLLLTKAGGITTFEAIYSHLPMLIFKPFLEQESSNANFIQEKNIGWVTNSGLEEASEILPMIQDLLSSSEKISLAKENMQEIRSKLNSDCIKEIIERERGRSSNLKSA